MNVVARTQNRLPALFAEDETAWLDEMAELIAAGDHAELDYANLQEYLTDMAKRDRREVFSRLVVLITHILKWQHQPDKRSSSWQGTIFEQRRELEGAAEGGVLRAHADEVLAKAYERGVEQTVVETGLLAETFPADCPYTFDDLLAFLPVW